jgi:NADPH2:quinone reductase
MRVREIELPGIGEPETLRVRHRDVDDPGPGQSLVRVEATGVSFAEQQMRRGKYYDQPEFPFVPGYDLVGVVESTGQRVAALTKVGAWADRVVLDDADLVPVPEGLDPEAVETLIVNGVTAWRMLHGAAKIERGQTIVVLGAAGGVGTVLVQLARHAGIRVIGTAGPKQQEQLRALGVTALDYRSQDVPARVRELAPEGVAAVFDHVGGPGLADSWRMLARGGTLVSYGTAATKDVAGNPQLPVLKLLARLALWNALPNGRSATFFNLWKGHRFRRARFRAQLRADLSRVMALLAEGAITPQIAARFGLEQAAEALRFAEAGGNTGKVLLVP